MGDDSPIEILILIAESSQSIASNCTLYVAGSHGKGMTPYGRGNKFIYSLLIPPIVRATDLDTKPGETARLCRAIERFFGCCNMADMERQKFKASRDLLD